MLVSSQASLPHGLDLVVDFVNTRDLDRGTDELATPAQLAAWLRERGLLPAGIVLGAGQLGEAIELREALRLALLEHNGSSGSRRPEHGGASGSRGAEPLERAAEQGRLSVRFGEEGTVRLQARADGFPGALAQLLVPVAQAALDGTWERVKACAADDCQWAFYDHSRNRAGRWCDMAVCGNRTKVRAYRSKRRA
jgi:predicted RNA-binding Zn ribbon-like protein